MSHRSISRSAPPARLAGLCLLGVLAFGCNRSSDSPGASSAGGSPGGATGDAPGDAPATATAGAPRVVFLGDSLPAALGLAQDEAFPAVVAAALGERGRPIVAVTAGVSGDTSAGGRARLDWILRQDPDVLVVGLGANDGLRGQPIDGIERNLRVIVGDARSAGARVLLLGMQLPPSYGGDYARGFADVYVDLARRLDVELVPFLLEGVAADPALNQPDGIHPTAEGQRRVAENVLPYLERILQEIEEAGSR
jgi:acyl-CoA thioesterase-1